MNDILTATKKQYPRWSGILGDQLILMMNLNSEQSLLTALNESHIYTHTYIIYYIYVYIIYREIFRLMVLLYFFIRPIDKILIIFHKQVLEI